MSGDRIFQIVSIVGIAGSFAAAGLHYAAVGRNRPRDAGERTVRRYNLWERLVHAVLALGFVGLFVTGFWPAVA